MTEDEPTARVAMYSGIVTKNNDPLKIGRVRIRVPGLIEPESGWALPFGLPGGGESSLGLFAVPPEGAEVGVWFEQGDPDAPRYAAGHWGAPGSVGQAPTPIRASGVTPEEAPQIRCFETPRFLLTFDDRLGRESFELFDKVSGDGIVYDSESRALQIKATTAIVIKALGAVSIDGLAVTIAGRPVLPGSEPI